jgi:hypothetical protein
MCRSPPSPLPGAGLRCRLGWSLHKSLPWMEPLCVARVEAVPPWEEAAPLRGRRLPTMCHRGRRWERVKGEGEGRQLAGGRKGRAGERERKEHI